MSTAKVKFLKTCQHCRKEFIAQKVTTQYCGLNCARKAHKLKVREQNIELVQTKDRLHQGKITNIITDEQIKVIKAKEYLTLKEAAVLLNISSLTLRRWIISGKINSMKLFKKHLLTRKVIDSFLSGL